MPSTRLFNQNLQNPVCLTGSGFCGVVCFELPLSAIIDRFDMLCETMATDATVLQKLSLFPNNAK